MVVCSAGLTAGVRAYPMPTLAWRQDGRPSSVAIVSAQLSGAPISIQSAQLSTGPEGAEIVVRVDSVSDNEVVSYSVTAVPFIPHARHGFIGRLVEVAGGPTANAGHEATLSLSKAMPPAGTLDLNAGGAIVVVVNGVWFRDGTVWKPDFKAVMDAVESAARSAGYEVS
jgi:hypothetical protein